MQSVKWLTRIEAVESPFRGHFVEKYRYYGDSVREEREPVNELQIRSVVSSPQNGDLIESGGFTVKGSAWSGTAGIATVEISTDDGSTWTRAVVAKPNGAPATATSWHFEMDIAPGSTTILARATDAEGNVQPISPRWNRNGYANNVVQRVTISTIV